MQNLKKLQTNPYYILEILSLICGALLPLSFAPYDYFWLQFPLIAFIFTACLEQKNSIAFRRGFLFGLGWFVHGIYWLFYSLYFHGGMPAAVAVITIFLLSACLSLFPALSFYLANRFIKTSKINMLLLVYPISWMIFDWLRGYFLTGFPWVQIGIAQIDTYLAGYAPLIGGLGVGLIVTVIAGLLVVSSLNKACLKFTLPTIIIIYAAGFLLNLIDWTQAVDDPIKVSLIQGNIAQSEKWKRENYKPTLQMYRQLTQENWQSDLIIWPETAIPGYKIRVPYYLKDLAKEARATNTDVLLGVFTRDPHAKRYYNSMITLDDQLYLKRHLVPLGEYFPLRSVLGFFAQWVNIPMSDIDSGKEIQPLIKVAGQPIGLSICFEDAFDRSVLLDLPEATLLVNVSNDAWFEDSSQPWQHHQIARMRAKETGRVLLRATNTGVTSIIDRNGDVLKILPQFKRDVLTANVQAYKGATPYVLWANYLLIVSGLLVLFLLNRKNKT
ncbi:Apolipoprotein N-acyltransferase / Copper homeostasis protein CutE [hydrothermal vent metagenome]|uniref:Apolipoprotein N-acyltransferase / Copper homeostasis protein CutE n=1 Tax=hydrothermal vent metagenome TaxID=652676 RepID=A0A3B0X2B5_9ZZZZ